LSYQCRAIIIACSPIFAKGFYVGYAWPVRLLFKVAEREVSP